MFLANAGFPFTVSFIGEILIFIALSKANMFLFIVLLLVHFFEILYTLWVLNRIIFLDSITLDLKKLYNFNCDLGLADKKILEFFSFWVIVLGVNPSVLLVLFTI